MFTIPMQSGFEKIKYQSNLDNKINKYIGNKWLLSSEEDKCYHRWIIVDWEEWNKK